ncbi:MAG: TM0106 family RecB-like putative nuclease [Chloroflexi bacterium]|nr:TM0106 family RecB-like putative nuclease [Chloroflexota bacterium]
MQLADGTVIYSASDLTGYLACEHLLQQELRALHGETGRPDRADPELDVLTKRGIEHERRYRDRLIADGKRVVEIALDRDELTTTARLRDAHERTLEAMRSGADVVYQGAFFDGTWLGYADFLIRVEAPSALGTFSYEVADTKLARHVKASALLQTCAYSDQLTRAQGVAPEWVRVVLGDLAEPKYRLRDYSAYYRSAKRRFEEVARAGAIPTYPDPVAHCEVCRWIDVCVAQRRRDDHLSLVAGLTREQTRKLGTEHVTTLAALAASTLEHVKGIGDPTLAKLERQARLQLEQRKTNVVTYELLKPEPNRGLARLPVKSAGDLFFDMEGDPLVEDGGLQYLFGVAWLDDAGVEQFRSFWAHDRVQEKAAFQEFVDFVCARRKAHPDLHIYHYAPYEEIALKSLMGTHATREDEVDDLLRQDVLVDLYRVVQQGIAVSQESYSIKALEPLYMPKRGGAIRDAGGSIVAYERWLDTREQSILDDIEAYNRDDCVSTLRLRDWLEQRRDEAIAKYGAIERPMVATPTPKVEETPETLSLAETLTRDPDQRACWLLGHLLGYHRREAKSDWWEYFDHCDMSELELFEDAHAISRLTEVGTPVPEKRSLIREYAFDPAQEHRIDEGRQAHDPWTRKDAGEVVSIDKAAGRLRLKRGPTVDKNPLASLIPPGPINDETQRAALRRLGQWVVANGIDAPGDWRAGRDLLLGLPPRLRDGVTLRDGWQSVIGALDHGCLPVQGPPGSGKTWIGAAMAVELIKAGKRVGITAQSHKVICNLLQAVCDRAEQEGVATLRGLQAVSDPNDALGHPRVEALDSAKVESAWSFGAHQLVAGTAWLFAREGLHDSVDVLFVDEAGQFSLANTLAVSGAAKSIVLLGDPNQLSHPGHGSHPPGVEVSALAHVLGDEETMPPDRGLFLEKTFRMRSDISGFISAAFYEGRLASQPDCDRRTLDAGTGMWIVPVEHADSRVSSEEEADAVCRLVSELLGTPWTDIDKPTRPLRIGDVVIVAPFNAQVELLTKALPPGARVGTVDKFQGQEAAVAIYSMATSTIEEAPRGMTFLFSRNRLNVALSRAQALAVLVCSPRLLHARCKTPEEMRLANALALFEEMATVHTLKG